MTSERTQDWVDGIANRLIRRAARRAPAVLGDRLEEEWLADLAEQRGQLARLRFGIGCCWATNVIAREHAAVAPIPAAVSAQTRGVIHFWSGDSPFFTGRTITFVLVATLHLAVLYGLAMGLSQNFTRPSLGPFQIRDIPPPPRSHPPQLPGPQLMPTTFNFRRPKNCLRSNLTPRTSSKVRLTTRRRILNRRRRREAWSIALKEDPEWDFRVPMISIQTLLFVRQRRVPPPSTHVWMARDTSFPSRPSFNRPEVRGSIRPL